MGKNAASGRRQMERYDVYSKGGFCEESTDLFSAPSAYPKCICERDLLSRASWQVWLSGKNNTGKWLLHQHWRKQDKLFTDRSTVFVKDGNYRLIAETPVLRDGCEIDGKAYTLYTIV